MTTEKNPNPPAGCNTATALGLSGTETPHPSFRMSALKPKDEAFAQAVAKLEFDAAAYKKAYKCSQASAEANALAKALNSSIVPRTFFWGVAGTLANTALVCRKFESYRRRELLTFGHHAAAVGIPPQEADPILVQAERERWTRQDVRDAVSRINGTPTNGARPIPRGEDGHRKDNQEPDEETPNDRRPGASPSLSNRMEKKPRAANTSKRFRGRGRRCGLCPWRSIREADFHRTASVLHGIRERGSIRGARIRSRSVLESVTVYLPFALERKYKAAPAAWIWQYV